jgi:hypothetical protein
VGTGSLLAFRLPPGSSGGAGLVVLDMTRHEWGAWHTWIGYAFLALIAIHLDLHWKWLWRVAAGSKSWRSFLDLARESFSWLGWHFNRLPSVSP